MITHIASTRTHTRRALGALLAVCALGATVLAAAPANAAAPAPAQSCWENVDTGETGCFDAALDPQEQIELATGNPLVAVETGSAARAAAPAAAAVEYLLVTGWDDINQTGASKSLFTSTPSVCGTYEYGFQTLTTFNDRFESIQSYNGCTTTLFDEVNFRGVETAPIASSNDLGTFKNRASSLIVG